MPATPKIQDYAPIGDGRSVALISRHGSLDWLCWPRFDSPSLFAGLLDARVGGAWSISPTEPVQVERRYLTDTNVLQTRFHTATGSLALTDFMPAASEEEKRQMLWPEQELIRRVECERGEIEVRGSHLIILLSDVQLAPAAEGGASARVRLRAGASATFSLLYSSEGPAVLPPVNELCSQKLALTTEWWRRWVAPFMLPASSETPHAVWLAVLRSPVPSASARKPRSRAS